MIEANSRRTTHMYSPNRWMTIVKEAKRKNSFNVIEMRRTDLFSTKELEESIVSRKKNIDSHNFNWLQMRWLRYEKSCPLTLKYKSTINPVINLAKAGRRMPVLSLLKHQELLYTQRRPITETKKRDMFDLLPFIPPFL
ncbi:hypothetical protein PR048_005411 [Dryococelus australis]|uniref:Uncharacterized protein n=1 Tax=Dryococelus australis TaxID=614101 RepID=A0ABQ9I829_9NEOP|nr:hypothetical protein PR048_005411 [Dryococelus australis]